MQQLKAVMDEMNMYTFNKAKNSLKYRLAYQASKPLSRLLSGLGHGKYGHGPRLTRVEPLTDLGLPVECISLDLEDVHEFWRDLSERSERLKGLVEAESFWQKIPQYYFTWKTLEPTLTKPESVYIDIAGTANSAYHEMLRLLATKTSNIYIQDLKFPRGVSDKFIGGSAADLPLLDDSVDAMTLHCSIEHFEGDADTGFVKEAGRVLRPGGKVCIVPLYMGEYPFILCDPSWGRNITADKDTVVHFSPRWGERHGRFYSGKTLMERIIKPAQESGLVARIIHFTNVLDLNPAAYTHFGLILGKR